MSEEYGARRRQPVVAAVFAGAGLALLVALALALVTGRLGDAPLVAVALLSGAVGFLALGLVLRGRDSRAVRWTALGGLGGFWVLLAVASLLTPADAVSPSVPRGPDTIGEAQVTGLLMLGLPLLVGAGALVAEVRARRRR